MRWTRTDLITLVLALLVPAGAYLGYFRSRLAHLNELSREVADLEERADAGQETSSDVARARATARRLEASIERFMGSVTAEADAHTAVGGLVEDANRAGVTIDLIRPGEPARGAVLGYVPIHLNASGKFAAFYDFLARIERSPTVMTVHRMEVESKLREDRCVVRLELRIYFVPSEPAGSAGRPA
jgi:Tfp pilus assembly protein PilO